MMINVVGFGLGLCFVWGVSGAGSLCYTWA
jgi:hypothetical protein